MVVSLKAIRGKLLKIPNTFVITHADDYALPPQIKPVHAGEDEITNASLLPKRRLELLLVAARRLCRPT